MKPRKRKLADAVRDIRGHRTQAAFHHLQYIPNLRLEPDQRILIEDEIKANFERWWSSWIDPLLDELEGRLDRKKKLFDAISGEKDANPWRDQR